MHLSTYGARVKRTFIPRPPINATPPSTSPPPPALPVRAVASTDNERRALKGGAASTRRSADGGRFAMGNTEEALIVANLGVPERGAKADDPWRRAMGTGWVRETLDHDYADAQRRGHPVTRTGHRDHGRALPHLRPRLASAW